MIGKHALSPECWALTFLLALALPLSAETATVAFTPEPMAVTRAVYGNVAGVGTWSVRICSDSTEPVALDTGRIYLAAPDLRLIGKNRALVLLAKARRDRPALRVARAIEWGMIGATAFAASERASVDLVKYLALSIPLAKRAAANLEERAPAFDSAELLDGKVILEPWGCAERTVFAAIQRSVKPLRLTIPLPPAPLPRGVSSIPSKGL